MSRPKQARLSSGTDKVGRAKGRPGVGRDAMDVDHNVVGGQKGGAGAGVGKEGAAKQGRPGQAVGKTQVELDEEMRVWERARRFGA